MAEPSHVLDASAVLALIHLEPGADVVAEVLQGAVISAVNLSEAVARLCDRGVPERGIRAVLDQLEFEIVDFDEKSAYRAGLLRTTTRPAGLSFGDRACLALAEQLNLPALTADRSWEGLQ